MAEGRVAPKQWLRLSYIPRRAVIAPQQPIQKRFDSWGGSLVSVAQQNRTPSPVINKPSVGISDETKSLRQTRTLSPTMNKTSLISHETRTTQQNRIPSPIMNKPSLVYDDINLTKQNFAPSSIMNNSSLVSDELLLTRRTKQAGNCLTRWFNNLSLKQKIFVILVIIFVLLAVATVAVIPPIYFLVILRPIQQSSFANMTVSTCSATTCIGKETPYRSSMVTALYPFDGNPNDLTGYAIGTPFGTTSPTYGIPNYVGTNSMLLTAASGQYIQIPYVNLAQSFTIETWIYPMAPVVPDYAIFSQCDTNSNCLSISVRSGRLTVSFDSMNPNNYTLVGAAVINVNIWAHVTVVYDALLYQQRAYVNGRIDAINSGIASPFAGTSSGSVTTIGKSMSYAYGSTFFQGRIDHFTISAGVARTTCQIYNDASLVAYYPFDSTATFNDYSVNLFHGTASGVTTISQGRFGQAIYFSSNTSYFQTQCFLGIGTTAPITFSISLWINPDNRTDVSGSLIHISTLQNGTGNCYELLSFSSTGALVVQLMQTAAIVNATQSAIIPANTWTHVAVVYGATNGLRIYINGQLNMVSLSTVQNLGSTTPLYITLGNNNPLGSYASVSCRNGSIPIVPGPYKGAIDEFRLYSRELDNQEICVLANP